LKPTIIRRLTFALLLVGAIWGVQNFDLKGGGEISASPSASPLASELPEPAVEPIISEIGDDQWEKIVSTGTWTPGCPVNRDQLSRIEIGYFDFKGKAQRGALIAHQDSAQDLIEIFSELFAIKFPIERMIPVEEYSGDAALSLAANNTSAFNCRKPGQINAPIADSPHANGRAVDINPIQNPWMDLRCDCWMPSDQYSATSGGPGIIRETSPVVQMFVTRGWVWQNIKVPDYMHFDTGYPSVPRQG